MRTHGINKPLRAPFKVKTSIKSREWEAFLALEKKFPIFPSPQGCVNHGAKVSFNETLRLISEQMQMSRPRSERMVDLKKPPHDLVLKREYSDAGHDVYIPKLASKVTKQTKVRQAAAFIKTRMDRNKDLECSWLAQEYVPFLPIGEVRFMCVGGEPIRDIMTGKNANDHPKDPGELWGYERNTSLKTVSKLQ